MLDAPAIELIDDVLGCARIEVACGTDLHCGCAREQELDYVASGGNSAHADYWDIHGFGGLIDHAQSDWLDRRTR